MNCEVNRNYFVLGLNTQNIGVSRRLSELGFFHGARVKVLCFSALKKTVLIEIEGYALSLRSSVASLVFVGEKCI